jgi:hypothetical protein
MGFPSRQRICERGCRLGREAAIGGLLVQLLLSGSASGTNPINGATCVAVRVATVSITTSYTDSSWMVGIETPTEGRQDQNIALNLVDLRSRIGDTPPSAFWAHPVSASARFIHSCVGSIGSGFATVATSHLNMKDAPNSAA